MSAVSKFNSPPCQGCGLNLDVPVSRPSQDVLTSHLVQIAQSLSLGNMHLRFHIGLSLKVIIHTTSSLTWPNEYYVYTQCSSVTGVSSAALTEKNTNLVWASTPTILYLHTTFL